MHTSLPNVEPPGAPCLDLPVPDTNADQIMDTYPLSPMQQGMLFHYCLGCHPGEDIEQIVCSLHETLNRQAFRVAWERVVSRHAVLRTSFRWEGLPEPLQDVHLEVELPFTELDWTRLSVGEQEAALAQFLLTDRLAGFDLARAPGLRVTVAKLDDDEFKCVWTIHHILLDGRSFPTVLNEVFSVYDAMRRGEDAELPERRPFRQYIDWLLTQDWSKSEDFWRKTLKGFTVPTTLRTIQPATTNDGQDSSKGCQEIAIPESLTSSLKAFAAANAVTLNTLVQGAWAILLSRYSGEEDVVFGTIRACRRFSIPEADSVVGIFINTVPMRIAVPPSKTVGSWLKDLRDQGFALQKHERTPLFKIQQWSEIPGRKTLFDSLIMFDHLQLNSAMKRLGPVSENREFEVKEQVNHPLVLQAYGESRLLLRIEYRRSEFDSPTVSRMLGHLQVLLAGMAADAGKPIASLPLLTEVERDQILGEWNNTGRDYPPNALLHHLFEAQVVRTPDAVALVFENQQLTYRQLERRANQLAWHLRSLGVGPDTLVGVCMERSLEMVISLYAILKAGGAYVPIDPEYPSDRVAFMIADAGVRVLLTQSHLQPRLPSTQATVISLDSAWDRIAQESPEKPQDIAGGSNLAYMIYTSGSTGKPKGALNEHRGIINRLLWLQDEYPLTETDVVMQKTPFSFDVSIWEFFGPLLAGAKLVVAKPGGHKDPGYLIELIKQRGITAIHFVPPMFRAFLAESRADSCTSLRRVVCSGEALTVDLEKIFFKKFDGAMLQNLYGPTEAAVEVTYWICRPESSLSIVPIGKPVANTQAYILDSGLQLMPIGVPGELHIGGVQVGRGYHNRPELTSERFIPDPFRSEPGARLYKTGDLCRYLADGNIEYLGRLDHQVKIRGFRVELGEIEARLAEHPSVKENVVVAQADGSDKRLVGYLVCRSSPTPSNAALRAHLGRNLPEFMVPSVFLWLDALPLSPNGKVDRRSLPRPDQAALGNEYVPARSETERELGRIWSELLKIERIGVRDDFFDLGGHSITVLRATSLINERFQCDLPPGDMFDHRTIEALALHVQANLTNGK